MNLIKKYKVEIIIFTLLTFFYFLLRLYNIMSFPIFTDEAIYVRWSQIARYDAAWRFISLTDGKQPSFVWATMNVMRFVNDPLLAGRLTSVFAGFFTMMGMFLLGKEIFKNRWIGFVSAMLYLFYPMALVYDRMALYDSLVGMFAVWSLYLEILLIRYIRLDIALILGMVIGGGVLTKTSNFFSIYLLPFSLLLFDLKQKSAKTRFLKWLGLAIVATIMAYGYYSILRLFPLYNVINEKNSVFVYPFHDWIHHPFEFFHGNLAGMIDWVKTYVNYPVIILIGLSLFIQKKYFREKILLILWFLIPFTALALFGRVLYPRFIFFMTLPLLPLAAFSIVRIIESVSKKMLVAIIILIFTLLSYLFSDFYIVNDFKNAPIPRSDLGQYINGWPAGGGIKEVIKFLGEQASKGKIYVLSEGTFGSLPNYAVEIYLGDNRNVDKRGLWPIPEEIPSDLPERAKKMPVYVIFYQSKEPPKSWPLKLIAKYQKGNGESYLNLYQVIVEK